MFDGKVEKILWVIGHLGFPTGLSLIKCPNNECENDFLENFMTLLLKVYIHQSAFDKKLMY